MKIVLEDIKKKIGNAKIFLNVINVNNFIVIYLMIVKNKLYFVEYVLKCMTNSNHAKWKGLH
jgi:hypothetical protein